MTHLSRALPDYLHSTIPNDCNEPGRTKLLNTDCPNHRQAHIQPTRKKVRREGKRLEMGWETYDFSCLTMDFFHSSSGGHNAEARRAREAHAAHAASSRLPRSKGIKEKGEREFTRMN
jgi:hypothetical protein